MIGVGLRTTKLGGYAPPQSKAHIGSLARYAIEAPERETAQPRLLAGPEFRRR